jgi:hypothetical protein
MTLTDEILKTIVEATARRTVELLNAQKPAAEVEPVVPPVDKTLRIEEVKSMLRCQSTSATYATLKALGVKPYLRGRYLWHDIHNAQGRASFKARKAVKEGVRV